jgi:hypothetical protein
MNTVLSDPRPPELFVGLDLGQVNDPTALALLHRQPDATLHLRVLDRALGKKYPQTVREVAAWMKTTEMAGAVLAADMTGVGRPVVEALWEALPGRAVLGVTVTSGSGVTSGDPGCLNVPKKVLVSTAQLLLQGKRLKVGKQLPLADLLVRELTNFKVKVTAHANEVFAGDWREGEHDDLVFAVSLACWLAENWQGPYTGPLCYSYPWPGDGGAGGLFEGPKPPSNWIEALEDLGRGLDWDWDDDPGDPWRR